MLKTQNDKRVLKVVREKGHITYKDRPIRIISHYLTETFKASRAWKDEFQGLKARVVNPDYYTQ